MVGGWGWGLGVGGRQTYLDPDSDLEGGEEEERSMWSGIIKREGADKYPKEERE